MKNTAIKIDKILLPNTNDMSAWACIACDQFTSEIDYWNQLEKTVEGKKTTLDLTLPEIYLEDNPEQRIERINRNIKELKNYVKSVTLKEETGHDWWHIERVYNTSITIAKKEKVQIYIVEIISLMHDLYDHKFFNGNPEKEILRTLKNFNLTKELSTKDIDNIVAS